MKRVASLNEMIFSNQKLIPRSHSMVSLSEALASTIANFHCSQSKIVSGFEFIDTADDHLSWVESKTSLSHADNSIVELICEGEGNRCSIRRKYSLDTLITDDTLTKDSNSNLPCSGFSRSPDTCSMITRYKSYRDRPKRTFCAPVQSKCALTLPCPIPKWITFSSCHDEQSTCFTSYSSNQIRRDCEAARKHDFVPLCELALLMSKDLKRKINQDS
jgi:hypothetical protein